MDQRPITPLLQKVQDILQRYVHFRESSYYLVLSLYILFTYAFKQFDSLPYVLVTGPFGSGKTLILQILKLLCYRALPATSISPAAFYHVINSLNGTLLIDEVEEFSRKIPRGFDMAVVLNGYKRAGFVVRVDPRKRRPIKYKCYGPKVIANTGGIYLKPLLSRCIVIKTVYSVRSGRGEIRRVNANIAPLTIEEFHRLKDVGIGTYQLFQETYHRETYARVHTAGRKKDYDWRVTAMDRAMQARIDDVGIGVLFGLFDWRFEILALLQHIRHLEARFGVGPHTISVPRLEPATGADLASHPPYPVSDVDFRKIVAILRLAVPYTGIIMSTRETPNLRRETFALGVSQISAGSRTNPGGYAENEDIDASQFSLGDHRPLDEVVRDVSELGYIPSFCTACYRLGRTGQDFMDLAKPGEIKHHCDPNALSTFLEYLIDYASASTREAGERRIAAVLAEMDDGQRRISEKLLDQVRSGKRDVFV